MIYVAFDIVLVIALIWLALRSVTDRDLLRSVVQFIIMGLLLAVAWVRLGAPDVALAEAAVGSGLTGALVLSAWARKRDAQGKKDRK
mgnify:FL=1|jgi:uncharacterized MnhB-related membrane protein